MYNPISPAQQNTLRSLIQKHSLQRVEDRILAFAQNCIYLEVAPRGEETRCLVGSSHLGGLPDVPPHWSWPEGLAFLGQFNLAEFAPHDHNHLLPPQGLLSFFFNMYGSQGGGLEMPHKVFFFEDALENLQRAKAPRGYLPIGMSTLGDGRDVYWEVPITPHSSISLPSGYTEEARLICQPDERTCEDLSNAFYRLCGDIDTPSSRNQLLGHHAFMDGSANERAWEDVTGVSNRLIGKAVSDEEKENTLRDFEKNIAYQQKRRIEIEGKDYDTSLLDYYEKRRDKYLHYLAHKEDLDRQINDIVLLFQMDSDDNVGTMFSDAGFAYFMIFKQDLAATRFDRTYASMWSS